MKKRAQKTEECEVYHSGLVPLRRKLAKLTKKNKELNRRIEWWNLFADCVEGGNRRLFDTACDYADDEQGGHEPEDNG